MASNMTFHQEYYIQTSTCMHYGKEQHGLTFGLSLVSGSPEALGLVARAGGDVTHVCSQKARRSQTGARHTGGDAGPGKSHRQELLTEALQLVSHTTSGGLQTMSKGFVKDDCAQSKVREYPHAYNPKGSAPAFKCFWTSVCITRITRRKEAGWSVNTGINIVLCQLLGCESFCRELLQMVMWKTISKHQKGVWCPLQRLPSQQLTSPRATNSTKLQIMSFSHHAIPKGKKNASSNHGFDQIW